MHSLVKSTSGRIFAIAAEIAAANHHSAMKPVGVVMLPVSAKRIRKIKGRTKRKKLKIAGAASMNLPDYMGDESGEEGEDWLGKDEGFVSAFSVSVPLSCLASNVKALLDHIQRNPEVSSDLMIAFRKINADSGRVVEAVMGEVKPFEDEDKNLKSVKPTSAIKMESHPSNFEGWAEQYPVSNSERPS